MLHRLFALLAITLAIPALLASCGAGEEASTDAPVVNVYTHRHYDADRELFARFTEATGIEVRVVKASADELMKRLETEGADTPADVLITVDAGRLVRAKDRGLLQAVTSEKLDANVPANLRDAERHWYGLTTRARVVVYSKDRVADDALTTYADLTKPDWKGKILVRSSSNIYNQSMLAAQIANEGRDAARDWARGIVANMARAPKGNDRDQVKGVAAGIGDVAIVNTYYLGKLATSSNPEEVRAYEAVKVWFPDQAEGQRGTHVNASGAGVTKHAKNRDNAIAFLEFLTSQESQRVFAETNFEYPVHPDVKPSDLVAGWGSFRPDDLSLQRLGELNAEAVQTFDEAGWR